MVGTPPESILTLQNWPAIWDDRQRLHQANKWSSGWSERKWFSGFGSLVSHLNRGAEKYSTEGLAKPTQFALGRKRVEKRVKGQVISS